MIHTVIDDGIATLALARPERKNALNVPMLAALTDALVALRKDESVKALILTGEGDDFCAGGDVSSMQAAAEAATVRAHMLDNQRPCLELANFDRPVVAALDGAVYGAGFSLALTADFVVASERTRFCLAFARVGLVPDLGMLHMLPRMIGTQRARELIYSAREMPADEALALGLIFEVQPHDTVRARARELARALADQSAVSFAMTKRLLARSFEQDLGALLESEASAQAIALTSPYVREAAARFVSKEPPRFRWPA
jgi:2-(1,2-epoxy-1,2-dihydrophenyl)acetyl-CoA isomerase